MSNNKIAVVPRDIATPEGFTQALAAPIAIDFVVGENLVAEYVDNGFKASEVEGLERDIALVRRAVTVSALGFIEGGERIQGMIDRAAHGNKVFLYERMGISEDTGQRMIAAYQAYTKYPQLAAHAANIPGPTLGLIGQRKGVTVEAVNEIAELAKAGEATRELVTEILRKHAPAKTPTNKKHKTYFKGLDVARAAEYQNDAMRLMNQMTGAVANTGADLVGLKKSPDAKKYLKGIGGANQTPLQRALHGLIMACYVFDHPEVSPPTEPAA